MKSSGKYLEIISSRVKREILGERQSYRMSHQRLYKVTGKIDVQLPHDSSGRIYLAALSGALRTLSPKSEGPLKIASAEGPRRFPGSDLRIVQGESSFAVFGPILLRSNIFAERASLIEEGQTDNTIVMSWTWAVMKGDQYFG